MSTINNFLTTPDQEATLQHLSSLLHLLHHRNKNQHRRSVWWRSFSLFRRHLDLLLSDLTFLRTPLPTTGTTNLARTRKRAEDVRRKTRITQRLDFWRDILVARWQRAFSQLVADGRFAVIGVVLMAALAQVVGIVGIVAELEAIAEAEVENALEKFAGEEWGLEETAVVRSALKSAAPVVPGIATAVLGEDVGEVVKREDEKSAVPEKQSSSKAIAKVEKKQRDSSKSESTAIPSKRRAEAATTKKSSKKKKKKGGNAIDDLFSGLG